MRNANVQVVFDLGEIEPFEAAPPPSPERPPRRLRGRAALAVAAIAAAVALLATVGDAGTDRPAPRPATPTTRPEVVVYAPHGLDEKVLVGAPVGYEATGSLATLDVGTGVVQDRQHDVRLWPGDFQVPMLTVGAHLVWSDLERAWSIPVDLGRDPKIIGDASYVVPARDHDHVWLVQRDPVRVTEVGPSGEVRRPTFRLPPNTRPIAGVDGGLLLEGNEGTMLVDDTTGALVRAYWHRDVLAAGGHVAFTTSGSILDLDTNESVLVEQADDASGTPTSASFSPDGRYIAYLVGPERSLAAGVAIARTDGRLVAFHRIAGLGAVVWSRLAWSSESDAVYFLGSDDGQSADRVVGMPLEGAPQTAAVLDDRGWYWLAVD